jgi:hypothetical protein
MLEKCFEILRVVAGVGLLWKLGWRRLSGVLSNFRGGDEILLVWKYSTCDTYFVLPR